MNLLARKYYFVLTVLLFALQYQSLSAQDISGYWQGVNYQISGGPTTFYPASLQLFQRDSVVTGTATSYLPNGSPSYATLRLSGIIRNDILRYTVNGIISQVAPPSPYYWCTAGSGELVFDPIAQTLKGPSNSPGCGGPGSVEMWRLKVLGDTVFCEGKPVLLKVTGENVRWYSNSNLSTLVNTGNNFVPGSASSTTFYVTQTHYNTQSPAIPVNVTINKRITTTLNQIICAGQSYMGHSANGKFTDTLVSAAGCDSIRILNLTVSDRPVVNISNTICEGQQYFGYTTSGKFVDTITSPTGCDTIRILDLKVIKNVKPNLGPDVEICSGDSVTLNPGTFSSYLWEDGSTQSTRVINKAGTYSFSGTDLCGVHKDEIIIREKVCYINFPNAFTPNANGSNEVFRMLNPSQVQQYHLVVFNRWGQKVFETFDFTKGWNGSYQGKDQPSGPYNWYCEYKRRNAVHKEKGIITLVR